MRSAIAIITAIGFSVMSLPAVGQEAGPNPEKGKRVFAKCKSCHILEAEGPKKIGPHLAHLFGRQVASIDGYKYSTAFTKLDFIWDEDNFAAYIKSPRAFAPGTKMTFAGLKRDKDILDLIAYIKREQENSSEN